MQDHELEKLAKGLGAGPAERLDVERAAAAVLARLRAVPSSGERPARIGWPWSKVLRVAAAVAVLVTGGLVTRRVLERGQSRPMAVSTLGELSVEELEEVFDSLALEVPVHEAVMTGLESLNEAQLKELLRLLQG